MHDWAVRRETRDPTFAELSTAQNLPGTYKIALFDTCNTELVKIRLFLFLEK
jgi:hypothetical protein